MEDLNKYFDHTCLRPDATFNDIDKLCKEAADNKFYSICVAPTWVRHANARLRDLDSQVKTCTVIGFPHGNTTAESKAFQITELKDVVDEFDVVINIGNIKSGWWSETDREINVMAALGVPIKYIIEVGYLNDEEMQKVAVMLQSKGRVQFIKTCTGYGPRNVTVEDIQKIKTYTYGATKIKASGGIKTKEFAIELINAGADRIGSSSSVSIISS